MTINRKVNSRKRKGALAVAVAMVALFMGAVIFSGTRVSANHPVLVEGNCDSPVPGTTLVSPGTCGDFDGDGRIGTAEDTDGADRIFGTINAALGLGTGAAAGTGANFNGTITIVSSGRFAERIYIGENFGTGGSAAPGNVTLEAAPGVHAEINAVLQGDPGGNNAARQADFGIAISYLTNASSRVVTLRNLTIRNYDIGIWVNNASRAVIENCRLENNNNFGIRVSNTARASITNTKVSATGFRIPVSGTVNFGWGIGVEQTAQARISDSTVSQNIAGVVNATSSFSNVVVYKVGTFFNNTNTHHVTVATDPNFAQ